MILEPIIKLHLKKWSGKQSARILEKQAKNTGTAPCETTIPGQNMGSMYILMHKIENKNIMYRDFNSSKLGEGHKKL